MIDGIYKLLNRKSERIVRSTSVRTLLPYVLILCTLVLLSTCGDKEEIKIPETKSKNLNANTLSAHPEQGRLEMPHLRGGSSTLLVHKTAGNVVNYMIEWDTQLRSQRWSCYVLNRDYMQVRTSRYYSEDNQYPLDELLSPAQQWSKDPYYGNKFRFDHGHICPSADRLYSEEANYQTFFLTNMQPQFSSFNSGIWAEMEKKVRNLARQNGFTWCDTLYVCKGGTIDGGTFAGYNKVYHILENGLIVPRYFFMALLRAKNGVYNAAGLWIDQVSNAEDNGKNLSKYAISIDELERRTGIDFFCNLPDEIEENVESKLNRTLWGL